MTEDQVSAICKALGDPNRLRIVNMISGCEKCACVILQAFDITQPTLSHHMKILCETLRDFQHFIGALDCEKNPGYSDGKCDCQ